MIEYVQQPGESFRRRKASRAEWHIYVVGIVALLLVVLQLLLVVVVASIVALTVENQTLGQSGIGPDRATIQPWTDHDLGW